MMKSSLPKIGLKGMRKVFVAVFLAVFIFTGGYWVGKNGWTVKYDLPNRVKIDREIPARFQDVNFELFWKVWDVLNESYLDKDKLDAKNMVYGAIAGMVAAVGDPYTVFLPPEENKIVQEDLQGSFEGVGIQIGFKGTQLTVIAPLPETPAEKAGVKAGDFIVGIRDEAKEIDLVTTGISLPEAVRAIRGPKGSKVTLVLLRDGTDEPITIEVERGEIVVPSVILTYEDDGRVAHIKLLKFVGDTNGEWEEAVRQVLASDAQSIILDLRNNPGGYLQGSVDVASEFVENGTLVVVEENATGRRTEFKTAEFPRFTRYGLVVLVNQGSASASEILAASLRNSLGVKLVGETTFGKGTIQEPRRVNGDAGLHITVARWLTAKDKWINEEGVSPDIEVVDDPETSEDEQLLKALEVLKAE